MNQKNLIINIIYMLLSIPFYYLTKSTNILSFTISIYLYLILSSTLSHINNIDYITNFYKKNHIYNLNKIYKYTNISIILINIVLSIFTLLFSIIFNKIFNLDNFILINIIMSTTLFIKPILKNIKNISQVYNFKTLSNNIYNIYNILNITLILLIIITTRKLIINKPHIVIILIYISSLISFTLVYLLSRNIVIKNKIKKKQFKKQEERINYKKIMIDILNKNKTTSITKIIKYSYYYIGIFILYTVLKNQYGYTTNKLNEVINNYFLYGSAIINIIKLIIISKEKDKIAKINNSLLKEKKPSLEDYIINTFKTLLTIVVIFSIISTNIWYIIFNNNSSGYILYMLSMNFVFNTLYDIVVNIFINNITNKKLIKILSIGIITKIIFIVPLINSLYRMGYNMIYGDILINMISYLLTIILLFVSISKKYEVDFIKKFDKILDVIYYNIILCFILLLLSLIIPVKVSSKIKGITAIIINIVVSIIYIYIRKKAKNERINIKNKN